ncbi:LINE-1 reverse transcriptase-like protein [Bienertia sinuspersici]
MWLRDDSSEEVVKKAWDGGGDFRTKLTPNSDQSAEIREYKNAMSKLKEEPQTETVIAQMRALDGRMDEFQNREEVYWKQRGRQEWLKHGDKNSKFFHAKTKQRRDYNKIQTIRDEAGNLFEDEAQIQEVLAAHFEKLFTAGDQVDPSMRKYFPSINTF